jgi:hypothetical protein
MADLKNNLDLERCPHCSVDRPNLYSLQAFETTDHANANKRIWRVYRCSRCGGIVTAAALTLDGYAREVYPSAPTVDDALPPRAKSYLQQALNSMHAPSGAVMLAASSVDAMLKAKGYSDGSLYSRIDKAAKEHLITDEMAAWAHEVRLDANDQRHADDSGELPDDKDARRTVEFATALAQLLFVLPARVARGRTK